MEHITLYSSQVYLAEDNSNPDSYIAKFIICDFCRNKNGVSLNRDGIENWLATLKNKPLVGKIKMKYDGTYDFTGHNVKLVNKVDEYGNEYQEVEFDTDAFGTFFDVSIETIDAQEVIVASCEIWKRFTKACGIIVSRIKDGTLHTSWEIAIEKSHQGIVDGLMTKIIDVGRFIGHCLLGKQVSPAYDSSGLLEIASTNYDVEFAEALSRDIISQGLDIKNQEKEEKTLETEKENVSVSEIENENNSENAEHTEKNVSTESPVEDSKENSVDTVVSELTDKDIHAKAEKEIENKLPNIWGYISFMFPESHEIWYCYDGDTELDYYRFTYEVNGEDVTVSEPEKVTLTVPVKDVNSTVAEYEKTISEKDELIVKASAEITTLKADNAELAEYKQKFTEMEQEKIASELAQKKEDLIASVIKSGQITREEIAKSEELSGYVNELDKKSLMAIVGERLSASVDNSKETKVDTSEINELHIASNLNCEDTDAVSLMRKFINK